MEAFWQLRAGQTLRTDGTLYKVMAYLTLVRLAQDLAFPQFRQLVMGQDTGKMKVWLEFVCDEEIQKQVLRELWSTILDQNYVDSHLIENLRKNREDLHELITYISILENNISTQEIAQDFVQKKQATIPQPFKLNVPQPHTLPEPEAIPRFVKANPVDPKIYATNLEQIVQAKLARKEAIKAKTLAKPSKTFQFRSDQRPKSNEKILALKEAQEMELKKNIPKANPMPTYSAVEPIRLNAAAILREDALYKKKMMKEAKILQAYESELHDSSNFYKWKEEAMLADEAERLQEQERRRLEMLESSAAAKDAMEKRKEENNQLAQSIKDEAEKIKLEKEAQLAIEKQLNARKALQFKKESEENLAQIKAKIAENVLAKREAIVAESKAQQELVKKMKQEDLLKKKELISRIQIMEREANSRAKKPKDFDSSSTTGQGFLYEMSLDELHERLQIAHAEREEEARLNSEKIIALKLQKQDEMQLKLKNISRIRALAGEQAQERKAIAKDTQEKQKILLQTVREAAVLKMHSKIEAHKLESKEEAIRLASELKQAKIEKQFLNADKDIMEENKWKEVAAGHERTVRKGQEDIVHGAAKNLEIQENDRYRVLLNKFQEHEDIVKKRGEYDKKVKRLKIEKEEKENEEMQHKKEQVANISYYEKAVVEVNKARNPYATKVVETQNKTLTALKLAKSIVSARGTSASVRKV